MPGPYGIGHRAGCFENRHGGNQPDAACGKRTANPEAVPSSSSGATRADVSITNEIALRAVPEYLVRGATVQQGQRRDAAFSLPLYLIPPLQIIGTGHARPLLDQTVPHSEQYQFADAVQVQLFHDAAAVRLHGVDAEVQHTGDFLIGLAFGQQL